jgi:hypothetical protein
VGCPAKRSVGRVPGSYGTHRRCRSDLPGLGRGRGSQGPAASGCVPSLQPEKEIGIDHRRDTRHHWRRGHPCGRARRRAALAHRRARVTGRSAWLPGASTRNPAQQLPANAHADPSCPRVGRALVGPGVWAMSLTAHAA